MLMNTHRDAMVFLSLSFVTFKQRRKIERDLNFPLGQVPSLMCASPLEFIHMRSVSTGYGLRWLILSCYTSSNWHKTKTDTPRENQVQILEVQASIKSEDGPVDNLS